MFARLFGRGSVPQPPAIDTDLAQADMELRAARDRALTGDWRAARDVVAAATDWDLRGRRLAGLSNAAVRDSGWLMAWLTAEPDSPLAATLFAQYLSARAGDARGAKSAKHTSAEQFEAFADLSAQAEAASRRAIALDPQSPLPWHTVLYSKLADGHAQRSQFFAAFEEAVRRDPYNFDTHLAAVTYLCAKWFGSHEEMFRAARDVAAAAPPGSTAAMLPFLAHFEYSLREHGFDERRDATRNAHRRYHSRPEVQRELDACVAKWRVGTPRLTGRDMTCRHWQVIGYMLGGRRAEAKAVLDEIGAFLGSTPAWGYFYHDQLEGFRAAWQWANSAR